jgi:putative transposase
MTTERRDESPGYHHVVTRGNNKRDIFIDDHDRELFCAIVRRVAQRNEWTILAYCLMNNHYHLIISVGERGLARGMCQLNTGYACAFNARHGRINHLFGKRYWNRRIRTEGSLLNAIRYVVENPRRAGGSRPLETYTWSSYAATIGLAHAKIALARDELLPLFASTPARAIEEFRMYCSARGFTSHARWQPP